MNQNIPEILRYFDLTDGEIQTFLALLKLGRATAYQIAKEAQLKRPTTYVLVDNLIRKGLATTQTYGRTTIISPISPNQLLKIWQGRLSLLEQVKPDLQALYKTSQFQPRVQVYEGEAGVDAIYQQLPPADAEGDEIILFGSIGAILDGFSYLIPKWEQTFKNKNNPIRELINDDPVTQEYITKRVKFENPNYQMRVMSGAPMGKTDNIIFQNKLAIFSLEQELFVTVIESAEIAQTYRALFEEAWENSLPADQYLASKTIYK